jgi:hypothetical protein
VYPRRSKIDLKPCRPHRGGGRHVVTRAPLGSHCLGAFRLEPGQPWAVCRQRQAHKRTDHVSRETSPRCAADGTEANAGAQRQGLANMTTPQHGGSVDSMAPTWSKWRRSMRITPSVREQRIAYRARRTAQNRARGPACHNSAWAPRCDVSHTPHRDATTSNSLLQTLGAPRSPLMLPMFHVKHPCCVARWSLTTTGTREGRRERKAIHSASER